MSLIHRPEQITADVVALECPRCRVRFSLDDIAGDLRCPDCGTGGMIAHRTSSMSERFPAPLDRDYTPVPNALIKQRVELGLTAHEVLVVIALEHHRRALGDLVWPAHREISDLTGLSTKSVQRAIANLVSARLIERQTRFRGRAQTSNWYDLDPLWQKLANLDPRSHRPGGWSDSPGVSPSDVTPGHTDQGGPGHTDQPPLVTETSEEDVDFEVDVDAEEDPVGASPAPPDLAAITDVIDEPPDPRAEELAAFCAKTGLAGLRAMQAFKARNGSNEGITA